MSSLFCPLQDRKIHFRTDLNALFESFISLFGGDVFILEIITIPTLKFSLNSYQYRSYIWRTALWKCHHLGGRCGSSWTPNTIRSKILPKEPASVCWMLVVDMVMVCIDLQNMHGCVVSRQPSAQRLRCRFPYNQTVKNKMLRIAPSRRNSFMWNHKQGNNSTAARLIVTVIYWRRYSSCWLQHTLCV